MTLIYAANASDSGCRTRSEVQMATVFLVRRLLAKPPCLTKMSKLTYLLKCLLGKSKALMRSFTANVCSYDQFTFQDCLRNFPDFRYCISPGCPFSQLHNAEDGNIFICATCGFRSCINHNVAFHTGETCETYDVRKKFENMSVVEQEDASLAVVAKQTKKCPGCGYNILKSTGCDHMTCKFAVLTALLSMMLHCFHSK
jgi:hypothetical protein